MIFFNVNSIEAEENSIFTCNFDDGDCDGKLTAPKNPGSEKWKIGILNELEIEPGNSIKDYSYQLGKIDFFSIF